MDQCGKLAHCCSPKAAVICNEADTNGVRDARKTQSYGIQNQGSYPGGEPSTDGIDLADLAKIDLRPQQRRNMHL